ncbi:F-box only protein 15 isoform X1 [Sturnira hondurensis]|uniref:F-box only protein 15 isoform X1 n=2 Tax=Sturnira hondurensis TaxID=192404 RepID=UPI0018799421|nr:F-box only protein 15 isoform X1 [Sturnira hondurensis]
MAWPPGPAPAPRGRRRGHGERQVQERARLPGHCIPCSWDTARPGRGALGKALLALPCVAGQCPSLEGGAMETQAILSMPAEVLLKILSYLDAAALLCVGCVNRRFYHLANDNLIWIRIYSSAFSPKRYNWRAGSVERTAGSMSLLSVEDREAGHWKREYVMKRMASLKAALAQVLKPVNLYTGLPEKTKEALRISGIGWVIILREKSGREHVLEHVDLFINESSVTISWYGKAWPCLATLSTLDLCGVMPVFMDWPSPPTKNGPRWCSLVAKYSLSDMTDSAVIGCDRFVRLFRLDPGLLVGLWKREEELAFVMANLHVSHLVERSALGSATVPYELPLRGTLSDDSPEYGLRGYQLHVDLHSGGAFCLCSTFCNLFTDTGCIENGHVKLVVIHFQNSVEHLPLVGEVGLCWRTDTVEGCVKSCSIMDVTLLDEYGKPFWCFSSPVCMRAPPGPRDSPHFTGPTSRIDYEDAAGAVHMELVRIEETEEYFIVSLVLRLSLAKINRWFGTHY